MKAKNILLVFWFIVLMVIEVIAQNTNPVVSNVAFSITGDTVTVTYDVTDAEQSTVTIIMLVSSNDGVTWDYNYGTASGDIGAGITIGANKTIKWKYIGGFSLLFKVRIYANDETAGGSPCPGIPTVEYGGKSYNTIQVGTQCWLKENLNIGTMILGSQDQSNNGSIEKYCWGDDANNCVTYGGLYQWREAMQYGIIEGTEGICPTGWHVPSKAELQTLATTVGNSGNTLKAVGQGSGIGAGTNTSGFTGLLAGYKAFYYEFHSLGGYGGFWTSTGGEGAWSPWHMCIGVDNDNIAFDYAHDLTGFQVRCIRNQVGLPPEAPTLSSPSNGATNINPPPTLSWNASSGATSYRLQVSTSDQFTTTVYDQSNITITSQEVSGLSNLITYYWRVNATNSYGISDWSVVWSFYTEPIRCPGIPSVEYGGKTYNTVQIGDQCWLRENLDIGVMVNGSENQTNNSPTNIIEKYCYNNDANNCATYGGLYQWNEAMQYSTTPGTRGICPPGWHIPTYSELETLDATVSGDGNALKAVGQGSGSGAGTNTSGLSALLAGFRTNSAYFYGLGIYASFWSSTDDDATSAGHINLYYNDSGVWGQNHCPKVYGFSIRCLKNTAPEAPALSSPSNDATNINLVPTLSWHASTGAASYRLQVSTSNQFTTTVYDQSNITSTSQEVSGLNNLITYHWRVNASNSYDTSEWSVVWSFTTTTCPSAITYEGKSYNTILLGTQCWLKENLDVGKMILLSQNQSNNGIIEKYCPSNNTTYCNTYGGYYQWNEAMQYVTAAGTQGICPSGWHIPTLEEFQALKNSVGGDGNALKAIGQGSGAGAGTNTSGFSALLAGYRSDDGSVPYGNSAHFWSSSQYSSTSMYELVLQRLDNTISLPIWGWFWGLSIRCIKDPGGVPLEAPTLSNPSNGATNVNPPPTLSWNASTGAASYRLQVSTSDQFTTTVYDSSNITTTSQEVSGLSHLITYYWRVNAANSYGPSNWSTVWSFTTESFCPPTITYSGKTYNTVLIGTQCWLRENLDIGTRINGNQNPSDDGNIEKYCYNDLDSNCNNYGGLYKWNEAMHYVTTQGAQGICPSGWHIPTKEEYQILSSAVAGNSNALKSIGQGSGSGAGTNTSGFSALLAGDRNYDNGNFCNSGVGAYFWSSTEGSVISAYFMYLHSVNSSIVFYAYHRGYGFSVRCLRD